MDDESRGPGYEAAEARLAKLDLTHRQFVRSEWKLMNPETGQEAEPGEPIYLLAKAEASSSYRIYQLASGKVILVGVPQFLRENEEFHLYVLGGEWDYWEALRILADLAETL